MAGVAAGRPGDAVYRLLRVSHGSQQFESRAGLAGHNTDEVCDFLLRHFSEWKEKGFTTADTDEQTLRNYSRKEQAKQFAALFNQLTQHT